MLQLMSEKDERVKGYVGGRNDVKVDEEIKDRRYLIHQRTIFPSVNSFHPDLKRNVQNFRKFISFFRHNTFSQ